MRTPYLSTDPDRGLTCCTRTRSTRAGANVELSVSATIVKPDGPVLRKNEWEVVAIPHAMAAAFVRSGHYAKAAGNTSVLAAGLYKRGSPELQGVAIWLPPPRPAAEFAGKLLRIDENTVLHLSRLVVSPEVPKNGATFLMAQSIKLLRKEKPVWKGGITYADRGQGHTGAIYRAAGWTEAGETSSRRPWLTPQGALASPRAGPSGRRRNVGAEEMRKLGYVQGPPSTKLRFVKLFAPAPKAPSHP